MGTRGFQERPGRPRQNWKDVVKKDLRIIDISWDKVEEAAEDRRSWKNRVAQCVFDVGRTRNQKTSLFLCLLIHCLQSFDTVALVRGIEASLECRLNKEMSFQQPPTVRHLCTWPNLMPI